MLESPRGTVIMDESHNAIYLMVHPTGGILEPGIFAKVSGIRSWRDARAPRPASHLFHRVALELSLFHGLVTDRLRHCRSAVGQVTVVVEVNDQAIGSRYQVGYLFGFVR